VSVGVSLEVKGLQELQKKLQEEVALKPFHAGIKKATLLLQREVMIATPVQTGRLRASITPKLAEDFGQVGTNVQYASAVEFGRGAMEPRHVTYQSDVRILGEGPFSHAIKILRDKLKDLLGDVANAIEARWR